MTNAICLKKEKTNTESKAPVFVVYVLITACAYILPYTKFKLPYLFAGSLMLLTLPVFIFKKTPWFKYVLTLIFLSFFLMCQVGITHGLVDGINEFIRNVRFFIPVLWGCYALEYCNDKEKNTILIVFMLLMGYILINTIVELEKNPMIARILAQSKGNDAGIDAYRIKNIGGFEFSYMMGIIALCFLWGALNNKKFFYKTLFAVFYIISFYYIIQTMYTTLLILVFVCSCILLVIKIKNQMLRFWIIAFLLLFLLFLPSVTYFIKDLFPADSLLHDKFNGIYQALISHDLNEMGIRPKLILDSVKVWLQNPFFGSSAFTNAHSMLFGVLSSNGLVGLSLIIYTFYMAYKYIAKTLETFKVDKTLFKISYLYLILLGILNPINFIFELTITTFFIVPLVSFWLQNSQKGETVK